MGADAIYGTLNLLILNTLRGGSNHGLGVKRSIEASAGGRVTIEAGALYPALRRLEEKGLVQAAWGVSDKGRRARIYELTAGGERFLSEERARWAEHVDAIQAALGEGSAG